MNLDLIITSKKNMSIKQKKPTHCRGDINNIHVQALSNQAKVCQFGLNSLSSEHKIS